MRWRLFERDLKPPVDAALVHGFGDSHGADLAGIGDVGAAVGLPVEALDLDDADALDVLGDEIDVGADQSGRSIASARGRS